MHIRQMWEVQLKLCATPQLFSRATSPSLIVCLYLAYSKVLKLMATSNARGVRRISGRSLLDHYVWSLFGRSSELIPRQWRPCRLYKYAPLIRGLSGYCLTRTWADSRLCYTQYALKHGSVRHASVVVFTTQTNDDMPKTDCPKSTIFDLPPFGNP